MGKTRKRKSGKSGKGPREGDRRLSASCLVVSLGDCWVAAGLQLGCSWVVAGCWAA